ncbi:MAG: hypothetical protein Q8T03_13260 [Bacteroidota bacterium]|nr:hypothetical protein [Bacteroidota bacterium]
MPISPKGITLHEGYNDLGTFEIDITDIEQSSVKSGNDATILNVPPISRTLLFKLELLSGEPIPLEYRGVFTVKGRVESEWVQYEQYPNADGFIQIDTPVLPVVVRKFVDAIETTVIRLNIEGELIERAEEMYLEVNGGGATMYTLIWDLFVYDNKLAVFNGDANFYQLTNTIAVSGDILAIHITKLGVVYGYDGTLIEWTNLGTLEFTAIEFPENLTSYSDGFYQTNGDTGTLTQGDLGTGDFTDYTSIVTNPESYYVNVALSIFLPGSLVYSHEFTFVTPGSPNYIPVIIDASPPVAADVSPTIGDVQTLSGITFSEEFLDFLALKELGTVEAVRKAGPIKYINDFPSTDVGEVELATLQSHTDLYTVNKDAEINQHLIDEGYGRMYDIANTPKDVFVTDVVNEGLSVFRAAQIHEVVTQNQKLVSNLLANRLSDMRMTTPALPIVAGSNFPAAELNAVASSCGCDDCKSGISPFAYLMDLLKYGASHINNTSVTYYYERGGTPDKLTAFIGILEDNFLQPFGELNVSCETLHDEFCRVRLVTEILEKQWVIKGSLMPSVNSTALAIARNKYLTLVYKAILTQAGTSVNEVRDIVAMPYGVEKSKAVERFCNKLCLPIYVPSTSTLTVDAIWLTIINANPSNELTATNLEALFGFRDTERDVLTVTPTGYVQTWRDTELRNIWKKYDYFFSDYSREDVIQGNSATYKTNWQPIIDPDNIGWEDLTYLQSTDAKAIWLHRRKNTDNFISSYLNSYPPVVDINTDVNARVVRIDNLNIVSDTFLDDTIQIYQTAGWTNYKILNKKLTGANTDIILKKSTVAIPEPDIERYSSLGYAKYKQVVTMSDLTASFPSITSGVSFTLTWNNPVLFDQNGYVKLKSVVGATTYEYETSVVPGITSASFNSNHKAITLTITDSGGIDPSFNTGNITLIYEKEVPLSADQIINPSDLVTSLFTDTVVYTLLDATTFGYEVWDNSITWPSIINLSLDDYGKLKQTQQFLAAGQYINEFTAIINNNLHLDVPVFNRLMEILVSCENYMNSMFSIIKPESNDIFEMLSILRSSGKKVLTSTWVAEEIEYGTVVQLSGQWFWKSIIEPQTGKWDPSLQTNTGGIPIIDPEILGRAEMLDLPETQPYIELYNDRVDTLVLKFDDYIAFTNSLDDDAFTQMLNEINTNSTATAYNISPYTSLNEILEDLTGNDAFKQKEATEILLNAFALSGDDFIKLMPIITAYESNDPQQMPSYTELQKAVKLLVSAYKRMQYYPGSGGWADEEVTGTYITPNLPVYYYNVKKMKMAPGRTDFNVRSEWQNTLAAWNRMPFIQPDIVPPENVKNFVLANPIYTTWNLRKIALITAYNTLTTSYITPSALTADVLLDNLQGQIDLIVGRIISYTPLTPPFLYYPFFEAIKTLEANGDDIRPYVNQLGITATEYRYLANIIKVLTGAGAGPIPLLDTEYEDLKNIIIAIRSRNLTFDNVLDEYADNIILSPDYFQNYKPALSNFPLTDLTTSYNQWRSPNKLRKDWKDLLESRIEREKSIEDEWKEVLKEAEDQNMPFLRDALIKALTNTCLNWLDTAEKLAKTFFIETKDNCCFKHTRVSFALETLQGFYFALENGIFDDFVVDFKLIAPDFKREWEWLGTYSSWRSAVFVFLYPENLLYPTLKRLQSPKFIELSQKLQAANRFSPDNACDAAKEYDRYLQDIQELNIICSTSSRCLYNSASAHDCCSKDGTILKWETYTFAQGKSGAPYWCIKQTEDHDGLDFWQTLPIETKNITLLGCSVYGTRWDGWVDDPLALFLFYSYKDNGKTKIAYIKRPLLDLNANWSQGTDCEDMPTIDDVEPANITLCQDSEDWASPTFIFSFNKVVNVYKTITIRQPWNRVAHHTPLSWQYDPSVVYTTNIIDSTTTRMHLAYSYNIRDDKFISGNYKVLNSFDKPDVAIRHLANPPWLDLISLVFPIKDFDFGTVNIGIMGREKNYEWHPNIITYAIKSVVGGFDGYFMDASSVFSIVIHHKDVVDTYRVTRIEINPNLLIDYIVNGNGPGTIVTATDINTSIPKDLVKIYPFFQERNAYRGYALKDKNNRLMSARILNASATANYCALTPENVAYVSVESAECIQDMNARKTSVEAQMKKNMPGSIPGWIKRPAVVKELMYEAFYFVPMLLALDQQKRGQFDSALSWYRSVYDYTMYGQSTRKIFYGLKLEETIANSYTQNAGWLLDPLNPHLIAQTRTNAYTKYTIMNIVQCMFAYADRQYTMDTIETLPIARKLYTTALELLRVREINLKASLCEANSNNCITTLAPTVAQDPNWSNQTARLQNNLQRVANPETIDSLAEDIADLLNAGDEETMAAKFAAAFDLIDENLPPAPEPETVTEVTISSADRFNSAYSYVLATNNQSEFTEVVESNYAIAVAGISGIDVSELETTGGSDKLVWLYSAPNDNDQNLGFEFATSEGVQFMPNNPYNPLKPSPRTYTTSFYYYNAPFVIGQYQNSMPVGYTPLLNYNFCMPSNPVYKALNMKGNLELYKMFNCRNIAGMIRELDVYSASTDSVTGMPIIGASGNLVTPGIGTYTPSQYRFRVLIERAKQIAAQAQQMESMFLAALEKEDAENYSQLRARQDLETARATVKLQDLRIKQANSERTIATIQLDKATFSMDHFDDLLSEGRNGFENASLILMGVSAYYQIGAAALFALASTTTTTTNIAANAASAASALSGVASTTANILSQLASFQRRQEEWSFQKNLAGFDISLANQQVKVADDNIRVVTQERQIAQLNTDHAQDSLQFLQNKFTNAELYSWMGNVLESSYSYMLNLSNSIARTAEKQLYFERQEQAGPFILNDYWETPSSGFTSGSSGSSVDRRGLTGSARLLVDITRLDQYAFDSFKRKLQITKVISLTQNFPSEFQKFKETGVLNFELTNKLFDYDFPGHYLRLITSVKTTVVGLLPVYDQVKATLTADTISSTVIGGTIFQKIPIRRLELDSVALSSANNATGVFDMQPMQGEILNPFEGMGVESRWEFKMPQFSNRFDYSNIADVLLTVDYTAFDSYQYRAQVLTDIDNQISFNRGFSFKNHFPDQWYELAEAQSGPTNFGVTIDLKREMFPQGISDLQLNGSPLVLYFVREDGFDTEIDVLDFSKPPAQPQIPPVYTGGITVSGKLINNIANTLQNPVTKLRLLFDNVSSKNRDLFSEGKIKDVLLIVPCKAELKNYPL